MKNKNHTILKVIAIIFFLSGSISCNDDYLQETPIDFLSPENVFTSKEGFDGAIIGLHAEMRNDFWGVIDGNQWHILNGAYGTDLAYHPRNLASGTRNNYSLITSTDSHALRWWDRCFKMIKNANVIITRLDAPEAESISQADKDILSGQAKFFRAFAYKVLVQLFGGVPINREEIVGVKLDFVRDSKADVYSFIIEDLEFASQHIPPNPEKDGYVSKAAADHFLSEMYICVEQWDKAIAAASRVIDNPDYELMITRFGNYTDMDGDVYWDLFRIGNQNRGSGNKEAIFVLQVEWATPGGGSEMSNRPGHPGERYWCPFLDRLKDPDGNDGMVFGNFGDPKVTFGRGIAGNRLTHYVTHSIWMDDWNDMRNSEANIQRTWYYNNPTSAYFGQKVETLFAASDTLLYFSPYLRKVSHPEGYPDPWIYQNGRTWRDFYVMRLAETYLLRAEAKLGKGDKPGAAADINIVRARAHAKPVLAADVDIDYILDERIRELITEERRLLTLMRLGMLVERTKKYNSIVGPTMEPYNNLWPIPQSEIDRNSGAVLEQNPGY